MHQSSRVANPDDSVLVGMTKTVDDGLTGYFAPQQLRFPLYSQYPAMPSGNAHK